MDNDAARANWPAIFAKFKADVAQHLAEADASIRADIEKLRAAMGRANGT